MNYFKDLHIANSPVGVRGDISNTVFDNTSFTNVGQPFDVSGNNVTISGTNISESEAFSSSQKYRLRPKDKPIGIPVRCHDCGAVFPSAKYTVMNAKFFTTKRNQEICVNCKSNNAWLADGLFNLIEDTVQLIVGTHDTQLLIDLIAANKGNPDNTSAASVDDFFEKLALVSPDNNFSKNAKSSSGSDKWAMRACIVAALALFYTVADGEMQNPPLASAKNSVVAAYEAVSEFVFEYFNRDVHNTYGDPRRDDPADETDEPSSGSGSVPIDV